MLQGLAGDNIGQAVAGGLSPYVNAKIKELTKGNDEANIVAHYGTWGAIEAQASGNNALVGAAGAQPVRKSPLDCLLSRFMAKSHKT